MLGMSEDQFDLSHNALTYGTPRRLIEIRELLHEDVRANQERLTKISESLSNLKVSSERKKL